MRLVALIILAPVSSKTDVTTSSYEGKFGIKKALGYLDDDLDDGSETP